jgi:outer membrane autotransporter protein
MDGALAYAHDFYDVTRGIALPGTSRTATSNHGGNDVALDVGFSRPLPVDNWQITPRVGLSYFHIDQASFTESGAGSLDLAVSPAALNALYSRVGVAIAQPMVLGDTSILPEFRAAWLHNFLDTQGQFAASFLSAGTASFGQVGAAVGRDAGDLGVGVSFAIPQTIFPGRMLGFVQYDATLAAHETANAIAAGLRLTW